MPGEKRGGETRWLASLQHRFRAPLVQQPAVVEALVWMIKMQEMSVSL